MFAYRDLPIRRKLILLAMLSSGGALVLVCAAFIGYELNVLPDRIANELTTVGQMVASGSTAALSFQDSKAAQEILRTLGANQRIVSACVYDRSGRVFATYYRNAKPPEPCAANPAANA